MQPETTQVRRLPLEKLQAVTTLVTHDNCADGMASAMILKQVLRPDVRIIFGKYDSAEILNLPAEPGMLFCDFSPPASRVQEFVDVGAIVLDHHKTARPVVEAFGPFGVFGDEVAHPGVCGAYLAYREVWLPLRVPVQEQVLQTLKEKGGLEEEGIGRVQQEFNILTLRVEEFATLAGIRDTWQRKDPRWKEACAQGEALHFYPKEDLLRIDPSEWDSYLRIGQTLLRRNEEYVKLVIEGAHRFTARSPDGSEIKVLVFQGLKPTSDAAELVADEVDLVLGFAYFCEAMPNGERGFRMQISGRSRNKFDVSALASKFGGGGHTNAAGFAIFIQGDLDLNPYGFLERLVSRYLAEKHLAARVSPPDGAQEGLH